MLNIRKILLPADPAEIFTSTSRHIVQQTAWLARRFAAEVVLLHAVPPFSYPGGWLESGHEITARDLHSHVILRAQQELDRMYQFDLEGIAVTRLLLRGEPAGQIVETADNLNADLIMMSTNGEGDFYRFLLGSTTAKVLHETSCPVWTAAPLDQTPAGDFSLNHVLCSVELTPHSIETVSIAAAFAASVDAMLTLVHVTPSVEMWGPGGSHPDPAWKEQFVRSAAEEIAAIQKAAGTKGNVLIESGNVPEKLNRVAKDVKADLLVLGHIPGRSHLGDNGEGYGIIRASQVPVLSV